MAKSRKRKKHRIYRRARQEDIQRAEQEMMEESARQARANLARRMEDQLDALNDTFVVVYDEVESIVGDWMHEQGFDKGSAVDAQLADVALMHTELSEAAEAIRVEAKGRPAVVGGVASFARAQDSEQRFVSTEAPQTDNVAEELADCIIRIMHFGSQHGHNVSAALIEKCRASLRRPFMHGKRA